MSCPVWLRGCVLTLDRALNAGCFNFVLAWRRWANGRGSLRVPQAFFATFVPYLAAGVVVGSPSGDTRVLLVLNIMLLAGFLIHSQKTPLNAS